MRCSLAELCQSRPELCCSYALRLTRTNGCALSLPRLCAQFMVRARRMTSYVWSDIGRKRNESKITLGRIVYTTIQKQKHWKLARLFLASANLLNVSKKDRLISLRKPFSLCLTAFQFQFPPKGYLKATLRRNCDHYSRQTWFNDIIVASTWCHVDCNIMFPPTIPYPRRIPTQFCTVCALTVPARNTCFVE